MEHLLDTLEAAKRKWSHSQEKLPRWRLMEYLENIVKRNDVVPSISIVSKKATAILEEANLVRRGEEGNIVLTHNGYTLYNLWITLPEEF